MHIPVIQCEHANATCDTYRFGGSTDLAYADVTIANISQGPIVGALYDNYGPRWLLIGGSFLHVFGIMMASLGVEYYQILLAQGVCSGLGVSAIFQPCKFSDTYPITH